VLLTLAGLRISVVEDDAPAGDGVDVCWRVHRVADLPAEPGAGETLALVRGEASPDGLLTHHVFGYGGRVRCRFTVGPDGADVACRATPQVTERDLLSLFGEPILRTVLVRRGLVSFHAACLAKGAGAILLMGNKGMGKSTLSAALQRRGWQLLADDLTRVAEVDGAWNAFPGLRQTKLMPEAAAALGHAPGTLASRWDDSGPDEVYAGGDKLILGPRADLPPELDSARLDAIFVLGPRRVGREGLDHRAAPPVEAVRALIEHATPDPLDPRRPPPAAVQQAIGGLVRRVPVVQLALADRLTALADAAEAVEALAAPLAVRAGP
jgi:hypothetical protein